MTARDDDFDVTADLELAAAEPELAAVVRGVRALGDGPVPAPSAALAAVLHGRAGVPGRHVGVPHPKGPVDDLAPGRPGLSPRRRAVRRGARTVLGVLVGAGVATGAAALEPMPEAIRDPARDLLAGVVDVLAPWSTVDEPADAPTGDREAPGRSDVPGSADGEASVAGSDAGSPDADSPDMSSLDTGTQGGHLSGDPESSGPVGAPSDGSGASGNAGRPESPGNSGNAGRPESPGNSGNAGRPESPGNSGNAGRPENPGNSGSAGRPDNPGPPDHAARPGGVGRPADPGAAGGPGRAESPGGPGSPGTPPTAPGRR